MGRYCVHVLFVTEQLAEHKGPYPVWENVYVVDAEDFDEAFLEGERIGRVLEGYTKDVFLDGHPAASLFRGVRYVVATDIYEGQEIPFDDEDKILEVTYFYYEVDSIEDVERLTNGEDVAVIVCGK